MKNLPQTTPVEAVQISPEALEVANSYLQTQSIPETAELLQLPPNLVAELLARREVKSYIDSVFLDLGYNNQFKIRAAMDALINQKFQELEEAEIGSSKDIADLLALSHKMTVEVLDRQIQLEKLKQAGTQVNVQVNEFGSGGYSQLLEKLVKGQL